jgi:protein-S-isoprenylcysteine O-methyltransferase Ste14
MLADDGRRAFVLPRPMPFDSIQRVALASFFLLVAVFYTAKLLGARARTGQARQFYGRVGTAQWFGRIIFEGFRAAILALCVARVAWPQIDFALAPIASLSSPAVQSLGLSLMLTSAALIFYLHAYLGDDWRTGVAPDGPHVLITDGPYRLSRNPIFLSVHLGQIGFFLAWANFFTLLCLIVGFFVIQLQAWVEARKLSAKFGTAYQHYCARTPAWIGLPRA